ncbi:MAG TPA: glycoside hydrolase family 28 protein [Polyangiaceae bacterium]
MSTHSSLHERAATALTRRGFLAASSATGAALAGCSGTVTFAAPPRPAPPAQASPAPRARPSAVGWEEVPRILERIVAPTFPARDFRITDFGAVAGSDASPAIASAIEACRAAGGGRVVVPPGEFVTGPIVLASNVNLHVSEGATLKFVTEPARYPRVFTRWEGIECMNYCPLVYAFEQTNVAVTGKGTLDGQAARDNWWAWKLSHWKETGQDLPEDAQRPDARALIAMGEKGVPVAERVFGAGHKLRPSFFQPYRCKNVLVEGVTIVRSPMWEVHPVLCENVTVRDVTIRSHGPNNDGCDPESCRDVLIERCVFDVGDDCIAIKSGKNDDGRRVNVASENILVRNSTFEDGHGGVVLGSECSGHIRNVFVENCTMDSPNLERMLRFKNNAVRGGVLENVFVRNVRVGTVAEAVLTIDLLYEEGANGRHVPVVRNVRIDSVTATAAPRVMYVVAFPGAVIDGIRFADSTFTNVESTEVLAVPGSVEFHNVVIEPRNKPRSLSSRPGPM